MVVYQLPAALKYTINTTAGSYNVLVTGGPRPLASGDVIWSDAFPFGTTVTNITGSLGAQTVIMRTAFNAVEQVATKTETGGQMWVMPAGLKRDTTSNATDNFITNWAFALEMSCSSDGGLNCDGSYDKGNMFEQSLFGRWTAGNNFSASSSINEKGADNYISDYMNGGTLGEVVVNFNGNSAEYHSAFSIMGNCDNPNSSVIFGGYIAPGTVNNGGCADTTAVIPPQAGSPWLVIGPQFAQPDGSATIRSTNGGGGVALGPWQFLSGDNCIGFNEGAWYSFGFSSQACGTPSTWGLGWNTGSMAWELNHAVSQPIIWFVAFNDGYTGYAPYGASVLFPYGLLLGTADDNGNPPANARYLTTGPGTPQGAFHLPGDIHFNTIPYTGHAQLIYSPAGSAALNAPVVAGVTASVSVTACPSPALPAGIEIVDVNEGPPAVLGTMASCTAGTLTFQGTATGSGPGGDPIWFMQWYPAAPVANDTGGNSWPVATPTTIASLPPCGRVGLGVVTDGQTAGAAAYNAAIGSGGGGTTRLVFCDGTSWTYH